MGTTLSPSGHDITHVYADGGCILGNPSPHGGTWAYVQVNLSQDRKIAARSGVVTNIAFGAPVTNNAMEFYAVLRSLEALPDGWIGTVLTDSQCTIQRFTGGKRSFVGIPDEWSDRMVRVLARLGGTSWVQLAGHPSPEELAAGHRLKKRADGTTAPGAPVSKYQVMCDRQCTRLSTEYQVRNGIARPEAPPRVFEAVPDDDEAPSGPFSALADYAAVLP
jgi:ribonuclease HI